LKDEEKAAAEVRGGTGTGNYEKSRKFLHNSQLNPVQNGSK